MKKKGKKSKFFKKWKDKLKNSKARPQIVPEWNVPRKNIRFYIVDDVDFNKS